MTDPDTEMAREIISKIGSSPWSGRHRETIISNIAQALRSVRKEENEAAALLAEVQCRYHNPERCKMEIDPDNEWPYCCVGCGTAYAIRNRMKEKP